MKTVNLKRASLSALMIWVMGVSAFAGSYYVPLLDYASEQANWFLSIALIPAIILGVYLYCRNSTKTNGLALGSFMFLLTILLDALITVHLFIIPTGGNHLSFFGDPSFWILGIEYLLLVGMTNWVFSRKWIEV